MGRTQAIRLRIEIAATQYSFLPSLFALVSILAPFPGVSMHVKESEIVRSQRSNRMAMDLSVFRTPGVPVRQLLRLAEGKPGLRSCSTGSFPLRPRRQT